jgi:hypothetical protein
MAEFMDSEQQQRLSARFERFAGECAQLNSPLYVRLSRFVAQNDALLELASHAAREPVPNVLLGAVHLLLLKGASHELREYYPSLSSPAKDDDGLFRAFADFAEKFRSEIIPLVQTKRVQTNEVNRSAILALGFVVVSELADGEPLLLVEVGASAGLNLWWDRYRIEYSDGTTLGDPQSALQLACESRGVSLHAVTRTPLTIAARTGVDLHPIDLRDVESRLWLRALVWPDHPARAARLEAATALVLEQPPELVAGDALVVLPDMLENLAHAGALCVYHSAVLYQFSDREREEFAALLAAASNNQLVWQVSAENEQGLRLFCYRDGKLVEKRLLADFDAHGRWIDWRKR